MVVVKPSSPQYFFPHLVSPPSKNSAIISVEFPFDGLEKLNPLQHHLSVPAEGNPFWLLLYEKILFLAITNIAFQKVKFV